MEGFAAFLYRTRYPWVISLLALTLFFSTHTEGLDLDNTLSAWFPENDEHYRIYQQFRDDFGGNRNLVIVIEAEDVFDPSILHYIRESTEAIEEVDWVKRVYSLSTANRVYGNEDGIEVKPLLHGINDGMIPEIRDYTLRQEILRDDLVSVDATLTSIVVTFEEEKADRERARLLGEIRAIMEGGAIEASRIYYSGSMEFSKEYDRFTLQNQRSFTPPLIALIVVSILLLFRSVSKLLIVIFVVGASVGWTVGIYSLLGYSFNVISGMLIPLIVILSISDSIHILEYHDEISRSRDHKKEIFVSTLSYITRPCLATSLTTAFGLLSLTSSKVPAVQAFGLGSAIGILSAFILSIVFVPFFLSVLPEKYRASKGSIWLKPLGSLHRFNLRNSKVLLVSMSTVFLLAVTTLSRIEVNTNQIDFFQEESMIRRAAVLLNERLSGVFSVEVYLTGGEGAMKEPKVLQAMEEFRNRVLTYPYVMKATSLADQVKMVNRELEGGDPDAYRIPGSRELIAQELFLLSLSRRGREEMHHIVSSDYTRGRISVKMRSMSSDELVETCRSMEVEAREVFAGTGVTPVLTGSGQLFSYLDHYLVESQIRSFTIAFLTVIVFMFIFFGSWKYGFLSILPNLFPIVLVLGIMGLTGITLNVATVTVSSVALGIAADDTIHFISRFKRERREKGHDRIRALENSTIQVGRAIISTSLINILGFSILVFSDFMPTVYFGYLIAMTMGFALIGDLVFLPTSILSLWRGEH